MTFPNSNKLHKIQTIVEHFRSKFKETTVAETFQAIDEMMVPFKDKHRARVNMPLGLQTLGVKTSIGVTNSSAGQEYLVMCMTLKLLVEWVPAAHLLTFRALTHLVRTKM